MSELFSLYGTATAVGELTLRGDLLHTTATFVRIPKGYKAKIWCKRIARDSAGRLNIEFTTDCTASSPTWTPVDTEYLSAAGQIQLEKRRPLVLRAFTGKEAFRLYNPDAGTVYADVEVEITKE
jgi:hypothetical protein